MANADQGRPTHAPGSVNAWLLPMMMTVLLALGGWIAKEVVDHNASLAAIEGTLGRFNQMLEDVVPHMNKVDLELQQEKDRADSFEKHLEFNDKAIDAFRSTTYYPPGASGRHPAGQ
jgi:hypothetical protein